MFEVTVGAILVESIVERVKDMGLVGYSAYVSLIAGVGIAVAANLQLVPLSVIDNQLANQIISGLILSGGSNYVNSVRDKLKS